MPMIPSHSAGLIETRTSSDEHSDNFPAFRYGLVQERRNLVGHIHSLFKPAKPTKLSFHHVADVLYIFN